MRRNMIGLLLALGLVASACSTSVFSLEVGDCMKDTSTGEVSAVNTVDCTEPHMAEVYHSFDVSLPAYDGDAIDSQSVDQCLGAFEGYVGIDYASSIYDITTLSPTLESWNEADDREVLCLLVPYQSDDPTTGSAKGTGL